MEKRETKKRERRGDRSKKVKRERKRIWKEKKGEKQRN